MSWLVILLNFVNWGNKKGNDTLTWDAFGYYLYLPALFIYDDLKLENTAWIEGLNTEYEISSNLYQFAGNHLQTGHILKYGSGTAVFLLPGFFIAHKLAPVFEFKQDGFSKPYQIAATFTYFFWMVLGVFVLHKILLNHFNESITAMALVVLCFSTNLYATAVIGPNGVHCLLFGLNLLILQQSLKWVDKTSISHSILLGLLIGLGILVRPSNVIVTVVPAALFLLKSGTVKEMLLRLNQKKWLFLVTGLVILLVFSIQMIYWKYAGDSWFIYSYTEGFDWLKPHLMPFLFSFKKGWLVYTPIMILAVIGFVLRFRKDAYVFRTVFLFCVLSLYMYASWETWWYGGSFSQRPMAESLGYWAFGFAAFFSWLKEKKGVLLKYIIAIALLLVTGLNIFQSWQYSRNIIDPERMTKAYYLAAFLSTSKPVEGEELLEVDRVMNQKAQIDTNLYQRNGVYEIALNKSGAANAVEKLFETGWKEQTREENNGIIPLSPALEFTPIVDVPYQLFSEKDHFWLKGTIYFTGHFEPIQNPFALVASFHHGKRTYQYAAYGSDTVTQDGHGQQQITFCYITPHLKNKNHHFQFYFWNYGGATAEIQKLEFEVWEPKVSYVSW
jgi:hypothetical protein